MPRDTPVPHVIHADQVASYVYAAIKDLAAVHGDLPMYGYDPETGVTYDTVTVEMDPAGHSIVLRLGGASA